jgi:hypothetical protein
MAKAKFNLKDFLLRRGEVLVMGVCGFFLFLMMIWGAGQWGSANPAPTIKSVQASAQSVHSSIGPRELKPEEKAQYEPPEWLKFAGDFKTPPPTAFAQSKWSLFDPVAQPSTKRDNPQVLSIGEYQVNLTRSAMMGYDILDNNGKLSIAMQTTTTKGKYDNDKVKLASKEIKLALEKNRDARALLLKQMQNAPQPKGPMGPMGPFGERGPMGFNPMAKGVKNQDAERSEKTIKYIPLDDLEGAVKSGDSVPAFTVIPVRIVTIHAVVPYKKQLEEIKKALRLPPAPAPKIDPKDPTKVLNQAEIDAADGQAKLWGPWYDGFEVQRRVTQISNGKEVAIWEEWPDTKDPKSTEGNYKFEENYIANIDTKKIEDHLDTGYIPYFLKPEYMLAMPLPKLVTDLKVDYPKVNLKDINDNIEKLKLANKKVIPPAEWLQQIRGAKTGKSIYQIKDATNAVALSGEREMGRFGPIYDANAKNPMPMMGGQPFTPRAGFGVPKPPAEYESNASASTTVVKDVDNFLLRFVDSNVEPGLTYQYRIRLRMINPNYKQDEFVAVPEYAKETYKILYSKWAVLEDKVTVPSESYVYAQDVKTYREQVNATYAPRGTTGWSAETDSLNKLLQVKDEQVVVQMAKWMDYVRVGDSTQREPIGGWVVGEVPVGRGEFIGKKQIVRLPLWSSETQQYVLREITEKLVRGAKFQPKGWVVDFTENQSVLVDFSGGKVKTKSGFTFDRDGKLITTNGRVIEEDAAAELLIARDDGKIVVRSSYQDNFDTNRKDILGRWTEWVKEVEKHKAPGTTNEPNPFDPKKPGG